MKAFLLPLISVCLVLGSAWAAEPEKLQPRYELSLDANEFSVMVNAARNGVQQFGGGSEFKVLMMNHHGKLIWNVTINNSRLMDVWTTWMKIFTDQLVQSVDTNKLDKVQEHSLKVARSVQQKMEKALQSPIWEQVRLSGRLSQVDQAYVIQTEQGMLTLTGEKTEGLAGYVGSGIVVSGQKKRKGELEVTDFMQPTSNLLEMFVMSFCPYAENAEEVIIKTLRKNKNSSKAPKLDIRYIFYLVQDGDATSYTSMKGEDEVNESVVQMIIRDEYPDVFHDYLLLRMGSEGKWGDTALKAGLKFKDLENIHFRLNMDKKALIEREYNYVTSHYQIFDGSPQYAYEGLKLQSIKALKFFEDVEISNEGACGDK